MRSLIFLLAIISFQLPLGAQVTDSFEDGNIDSNPTWMGNTDRFSVETEILRLTDTTGRTSTLFTEYDLFENNQWDLWINMDFGPSSTNRLEVLLFADDPIDIQNGFSFEFGEGGNNDRIRIYHYNSGTKTQILEGLEGAVGGNPTTVRLSLRQNGGNWQLFTDYSGGTDLVLDAEKNFGPPINPGCGFFGLQCIYTSTRSDLFYFDDISIVPSGIGDDQSPIWSELIVLNQKQFTSEIR